MLNTKKYANKRKRFQEFEEGDLVLVHQINQRLPTGCPELQNRKYGPFVILKKINSNAYIIDLPPD